MGRMVAEVMINGRCLNILRQLKICWWMGYEMRVELGLILGFLVGFYGFKQKNGVVLR